MSSYPSQHEHHTRLDRQGEKKIARIHAKVPLHLMEHLPGETVAINIYQHPVAFTDPWNSHLLLLAATQCFSTSCQPELNSGCYWPLVCPPMNIISIVWNILVCLAFYKNPILRSSMNLYKTALALADLCCAALGMPVASSVLINAKYQYVDRSVTAVTPVTGLRSFQLVHANRQN